MAPFQPTWSHRPHGVFEHVTLALLWTHQDGINQGQSDEQITQSHQMGFDLSTRCQHVKRARSFAPGCDVPAGCFTSIHKWWDALGEAGASWGYWCLILSSMQPADTDLYRNSCNRGHYYFELSKWPKVSATYMRCSEAASIDKETTVECASQLSV